jgi:predicted phosphohydrolase
VEYAKIVNREAIRLRLSLEKAKKLQGQDKDLPLIVFLHFPPVWNEFVCREILDILHEFEVKSCYFGHIHGAYHIPRTQQFEGIDFTICAADYLNFTPLPVWDV